LRRYTGGPYFAAISAMKVVSMLHIGYDGESDLSVASVVGIMDGFMLVQIVY